MSEASPIDVGSKWTFTDRHDDNPTVVPGDTFVVTNIYVDEDTEIQLSIDCDRIEHQISLDLESVRDAEMSGRIERVNTGHEATQWRREAH